MTSPMLLASSLSQKSLQTGENKTGETSQTSNTIPNNKYSSYNYFCSNFFHVDKTSLPLARKVLPRILFFVKLKLSTRNYTSLQIFRAAAERFAVTKLSVDYFFRRKK